MSATPTTVEVALRVRPLVDSELARGCQTCLTTHCKEQQVVVRGNRCFTYNHVFGVDDSQAFFYDTAVKKLIGRLFSGYNVTILAYGQTGSGKTYSMGTCSDNENDAGIIPRAIRDIFKTVTENTDYEYKISVSFIELYKEQVFDLLSENRGPIEIREENKEIRVANLTAVTVNNVKETSKCLLVGSSVRATGATAMNETSSRSHAIFTITINQQKHGDINTAMSAKFHLVDLAGSERSKKTQATGDRLKEGIEINKGLLALGNVISALGDENQRGYISYRDSKLTRMLQDSLGGNSITLMIACVSPADYNLDETLSTLRYADRARRIKNKPIINQDPKAAEIAKYKVMIQEMQLRLANNGIDYKGSGDTCLATELAQQKEKNTTLVAKNRALTEALNDALTDSTGYVERALIAEMSRDRMKLKLCELQAEYGQTMDTLDQTIDPATCPAAFLEKYQNLRNLKTRIQDLQTEHKRTADEILQHEISSASVCKANASADDLYPNAQHSVDMDHRHELHAIEQQGLSKELQELNRALALKEDLMSQMAANSNHMKIIRPNHEAKMKDFEEQIAALQHEKEDLMNDVKNIQSINNSSKVAEQRRKRLQELELKITILNKKISEQAKVIKMNDQSDKKIAKLNGEIQTMKHAKVQLVRQMRTGNEDFRDWKKKRLQEICKLKDQDRRRQVEMVKMERLHSKQQTVLKRKWEEAASANKRLKDALAVQKQAKDRRMNNVSTVNKVQTWLSQELEVAVSTIEAQRTLEQLLDDRASLHDELARFVVNLKDSNLDEDTRCVIEKEKKQHEEDIELRNIQIDDLQQKIMDSDQDNNCKSRWDAVQTMIEAKCAMKCLFEAVTEAKRDVSNKDYKMKELDEAHLQAVLKLEQYEQMLKNSENLHKEKVLRIEREHQDKVFVLLRQLNGFKDAQYEDGSLMSEREEILEQELEKLEMMKEELEKRDEEIKMLKAKVAASTVVAGRPSLFPIAMPLPSTKSKKITKKRQSYEEPLFFSEEEEDIDNDSDDDPDWQKTPIFKRIQKMKSSVAKENESNVSQAVKRNSDGKVKCMCRGSACAKRLCGCRKSGSMCGPSCKCDPSVCKNQETAVEVLMDAKNCLFSSDVSTDNTSEEEKSLEIMESSRFKKPRTQPLEERGNSTTLMNTTFQKISKPDGKFFNNYN